MAILDLARFLIDNDWQLVKPPIDGNLQDIYVLYSQICGSVDSQQFLKELMEIANITQDALFFDSSNKISNNSLNVMSLSHINRKPLQILIVIFEKLNSDKVFQNNVLKAPVRIISKMSGTPNIKGFLEFLEPANDTILLEKHNLSKRLQSVIRAPTAFETLSKERAQKSIENDDFIETCRDQLHISKLTHAVQITNNKITNVNVNKLNANDRKFMQCIKTKIHYIPNLKSQTDVSLGDCSYLDTCHKLNSCRYVHYLQYVPAEILKGKGSQDNAHETSGTVNYTLGYNCSCALRKPLPAQWIRCDVRKFDFSILGKFSVVIADPAWNIHMNLPYGTCNDMELLQLPFNELQDEGILFLWVTGRAIELGKESLQSWGYRVINEVSWIKINQLGRTIVTGRTGHWLNHSKEHLIVGVKGSVEWVNRHIDVDLMVSVTRETSRKPDELYGIAERMVGPHARKLELFGRDHNIRSGWFTVGNQLTGERIYESDVRQKYDEFVRKQSTGRYGSRPRDQNQVNRVGVTGASRFT